MKYANGTEIKAGDKVVGKDHRGCPCAGVAEKAVAAKGQHEEFVFKNDAHGAHQPSLSLTQFLRADEAEKSAAAPTPPLSTAK